MADNSTTFALTIDSKQAVINLKNATLAVESFATGVGKAGVATERAESKIRSFASSMSMFRRAVLGVQALLGGFGFASLIKELISVNIEFSRVRLAMEATAHSSLAAGANFEWLRSTSVKLGVPL